MRPLCMLLIVLSIATATPMSPAARPASLVVASRGHFLAGKTGLWPPAFPEILAPAHFAHNTRCLRNLGQSGWSPSWPIIPDRGVTRPGQNRDNYSIANIITERTSCERLVGPTRLGIDLFIDRRSLNQPHGQDRRKRPRSKDEIDKANKELYRKTCAEIDEIHRQYIAKLPANRPAAKAVVYARYSTRFQDSIADQVRSLLDHALRLDIFVPRGLIFFDLAVRGIKKSRAGLGQVEPALRAKKATTLLLFSTSRLFRKQYRTLEFVDKVHKGLDVRCVFVKSGVDTNDKQRWEQMLHMQSMIDQFVVTMYIASIHTAHEGLLSKQLVFGTLSFGYKGVEIPGQFTRLNRPRCQIAIDEETSKIVFQIFVWFVIDRVSISEIVGRLNADPTVPLPPRASSGMWTAIAVKNLLKNSRYRGVWRYGVMESVYVPDGDYVRQKMRSEPLAEVFIEQLRIVPDELSFAAQARLQERAGRGGRPPKDGNHASRPKLLNGMLLCSAHKGQRLYSSGAYGQSMHCPVCVRIRAEKRPLYTKLNRALATQLICKTLADLVNADPELPREVFAMCQREAQAVDEQSPKRLSRWQARIAQISRSIEFTRSTIGESAEDQAEAKRAIVSFQAERSQLQAEIEQLGKASEQQPTMPTEAEIRGMLADLAQTLAGAASLGESAVARARQVVELLTGGVIELHQMGERQAKRGWLQARFRVSLLPYLVQVATGRPLGDLDNSIEVAIDIIRPRDDAELEKARQLYKQGKLASEIGEALDCSKSKVTKLLKRAAEKYEEPFIDGRKRRSSLKKKHMEAPLYQRIAEEVVELARGDVLLDEIATRLKVDRNTVTAAIRWWHEDQELPVPDGRNRRRTLSHKQRKRDAGNGDQPQT